MALDGQTDETVLLERQRLRKRLTGSTVEVAVLNLSGATMASLTCSPDDTVADLKRWVARLSGAPVAEQKLIWGGTVLKESDSLSSCLPPERADHAQRATITMHCVLARSGIAKCLADRGEDAQGDRAVEASLADIIAPVMQFESALSSSARPQAEAVERSFGQFHRNELVSWMVQTFQILQFDDALLHSVMMNFDRYNSSREARSEPVSMNNTQLNLLATISIEFKLAFSSCSSELGCGRWQRLLSHLCHDTVSLRDILITESEVLVELGWRVGTPTALTFLREFCLRDSPLDDVSAPECKAYNMALFLLELSLVDPSLHYGGSHPLLAAGALSAALRALGAPRERHEALLEDVATSCPDPEGSDGPLEGSVLDCEEKLVSLWHSLSTGSGPEGEVYRALMNKFGQSSRHNVASLSPVRSLEFLRMVRPLRASARAERGGIDAVADKAHMLEEDRRVLAVC